MVQKISDIEKYKQGKDLYVKQFNQAIQDIEKQNAASRKGTPQKSLSGD